MKCIIIGAGNLNITSLQLEKDDYLIACDGGYNHCKELKIKPNLIVGDLDSIKEVPTDIEIVHYPTVKDDTDMTLAIKEGIKRGYRDFVIYGAMGGRIEHELANIQLMVKYNKAGYNVEMLDQDIYMKILKRHDEVGINAFFKGYVSVFSYTKHARITINNMAYNVKYKRINNHNPIGIDNEATDTDGMIRVHSGLVLLIITKTKEQS